MSSIFYHYSLSFICFIDIFLLCFCCFFNAPVKIYQSMVNYYGSVYFIIISRQVYWGFFILRWFLCLTLHHHHHHHHHQVTLSAQSFLVISRPPSLSFTTPGKFSWLHKSFQQRWCKQVFAYRTTLARPWAGVHEKTSLMEISLWFSRCAIHVLFFLLKRVVRLDVGGHSAAVLCVAVSRRVF